MAIYNNFNLVASSTEQKKDVFFESIILISNDSSSNDNLYISFDKSFEGDNYYMLKPGEQLENLHLSYHSFYYKSDSGNVPFRLYTMMR